MARERIDSFGIEHLSNELTRRADIDAAAASCMVVSAIEILVDRDVPENKLISKLRADRGIWPSVAELIGTRKALDFFDPEANVELDAGPVPGGTNADLRLTLPEIGQGISIEFKAIGLSEEEIAFFRRSAELLPRLYPEIGVLTNHIAIDNEHPIPIPSRTERKAHAAAERKRVKKLPAHIRNLNGAVIAGHFSEQRYLERVRERIETALRQLPNRDECWVALWWSNGAPTLAVQQVLASLDLPGHVVGLILLGAAVAVPVPEIHYYATMVPQEDFTGREKEPEVVSLEDHPLAESIFDAYERSSGVRPTLLVNPKAVRGKRQHLLFRDGSRPIFPFNLLISPDPEGMREFTASSAE